MQVLVDEREYRSFQRIARHKGMTMAEWVRAVLRAAAAAEPAVSPARKLAAVREAVRHSGPTGDIDQMLEEIERGYRANP